MTLNKVQGNCYYTDFEKDRDRPTLGYIEGDKFSIMIDAGTSFEHNQLYHHLLDEKGLKFPSFAIITHWHWDHTFGMASLNIPTFVLDKTNDKLEMMKAWKWTDDAMKQRLKDKLDIEFADVHIRKEYQDLKEIKVVLGDLVYKNDFIIDLGNQVLDVKHVPSAHSEDSVIIYAREDKVAYVGDAISVDYYNDNYLDKDKMRALMNELEALDFEICITGHNDPVERNHLLSVMKRLSE